MKIFLLLFIPISILACSGDEVTTESPNETIQTPTDSVAMAPAFADFTTYVTSLEHVIENVDSVLSKYENSKLNFTQGEKDSSFFVVKAFMQSFTIPVEEAEDYSEEGRNKMEKKYQKYGFDVWYEEGFPYLMPNLKFLEQKFKKDVSVELDDYLDVLKIVFRQITSDAGLSIEWSELSEMIIACEDYVVENPDSKYCEDVLSHYQGLMNFMLWGLDNTPILDYWTDETKKQLNGLQKSNCLHPLRYSIVFRINSVVVKNNDCHLPAQCTRQRRPSFWTMFSRLWTGAPASTSSSREYWGV